MTKDTSMEQLRDEKTPFRSLWTRRSVLGGIAALVALPALARVVHTPSGAGAEMPERPGATKFEAFLRSRGIAPAQLARESGYTRQHLLRIRMGRLRPDAQCARAITEATRRLSREHVYASDLFDDMGGASW